MLNKFIRFFLENKLVAYLLLLLFLAWHLVTAPFHFGTQEFPLAPVEVDAIPDIGKNQQIVFTKWRRRSPQEIEDPISYPLTTVLLINYDLKMLKAILKSHIAKSNIERFITE